jgi:hypothetical protein
LKIIAHRGNLNGPTENENRLWYLRDAILKGFDIETDVWYHDGDVWLGHDSPVERITDSEIKELSENTWFHCKNLNALEYFKKIYSDSKFFWHQSDDFTLTSNGYIWTFPNKETCEYSILVDLMASEPVNKTLYGICTDYAEALRQEMEKQ